MNILEKAMETNIIIKRRMKKILYVVLIALATVSCHKKPVKTVSFIDADVQAFSENVLKSQMDSVDASAGAVAVMEVSTGNIIAWVELTKENSDLQNDSTPQEHAPLLRRMMEPGSLFFPVSMMIAMEDKKVQLGDTINTCNGIWEFMGNSIKDHNFNKGGYGLIRAEQAVTLSSSVGMTKLIYRAYENELETFNGGIREINWDNSAECQHKNLIMRDFKYESTNKIVVWQSIGYGFYLKPIALLGFYNAIANDGRMVQSRRSGEAGLSVTLNKHICSKTTLKALQQCLTETVANGTGKTVQSSLVNIAGITGNVQNPFAYKNKLSYTVSFCGYFPVAKPKYTCIVLLEDPKNGIPSGGRMAGVVVKEIAEWLSLKK